MISDNRIKMICLTSLLLSMLLCAKVYGYEKGIVKQGDFEGKHWEIIIDSDKSYNNKGVNVDGVSVFPCNNGGVDTVTIGKTLCLQVRKAGFSHYKLYNLKGESLFSFSFDLICKVSEKAGLYEFVKIDNDIHTNYLCDSNFFFIKSGYAMCGEFKLEGFPEKYFAIFYKKGDGYEEELYTMDMKMILPRYKRSWINKDNQGNYQYTIMDCDGRVGILDTNFNWIIPLEKRFSDIYDTTIAGVRYYRCKKDGYWGLYDTKFNEVIAPDFEDLSVFSGTNFIKFKLNGFWGVMTLQGRVTKTIIPTTRGYTNISRYIKSQKRFTYEMNGYKGECNHLGQQLSKIKVNTTATAPVSPNKEVTKASNLASQTSGSASSTSQSNNSSQQQTIVVEHHRDPVPVQEWQQCQACFGSGQCPYVKCGGSGWYYVGDNVTTCSRCHGNGKCTICAGKGGHYITVYR